MKFLQKVKCKRFTYSKNFIPDSSRLGMDRRLVSYKNSNVEDIYTIIGVTTLREGESFYHSDTQRVNFITKKVHKVYIVSKNLSRKYKVLPEDIILLEEEV